MKIKDATSKLIDPYYQTKYGAAYLGDSLELLKNIPDKSISLILTSPPFALTRKKEYGNKSAEEYVEWFLQFAKEFKRILKDDKLKFSNASLHGQRINKFVKVQRPSSPADSLVFQSIRRETGKKETRTPIGVGVTVGLPPREIYKQSGTRYKLL